MSELREALARALFLHDYPGGEEEWDSSSPEDRSPVWTGRADAILAALPRRWGVRIGEGTLVLCTDEEDARRVAGSLGRWRGTPVSWIEAEPEVVPGADD